MLVQQLVGNKYGGVAFADCDGVCSDLRLTNLCKFMGMEKANFGWYFQKISGPALAGYLAGVGTYLGVHYGGAMLGAAPAIAAGASDVIDVLPL